MHREISPPTVVTTVSTLQSSKVTPMDHYTPSPRHGQYQSRGSTSPRSFTDTNHGTQEKSAPNVLFTSTPGRFITVTEFPGYSIHTPNADGQERTLSRSNLGRQFSVPWQIDPVFEAVTRVVREHCNCGRHGGLARSVRIPDLPLGRIWV